MSRSPFPSSRHLALAVFSAAVALRALLQPISPNDFWWHLAVGRLIVRTGGLPHVDTFSWTRSGEAFSDQPWLAQVAMYGLHQVGGVPVVAVALTAALVAAYLLILRLCVLRTERPVLGALVLLACLPASASGWTFRPQVLALLLFAGFLFILTDWRVGFTGRGPKLWILPLLEIVWVNVHGSFVLGPILMILTWLGEAWERRAGPTAGASARRPLRPLIGWTAVTAAAMLVNPYGSGVLGFVVGLVGDPAVRSLVKEWQPPTLHTPVGAAFYLWAVAFAFAAALARRRLSAAELLTATAFFGLGLTAVRHGIWFFLATVPSFVTVVTAWLPAPVTAVPGVSQRRAQDGPWRRGLRAASLAALAAAVVVATPWIKPRVPLPPIVRPVLAPDTPARAVRVLRDDEDAPERLFHSEAFGSYLMWAAPERKVFIDVRVQLYPPQQIEDYRRLSAGVEPERLLRKYGIGGLLLDMRRQAGLAGWAMRDPAWKVVYRDSVSAYLVRRQPVEGEA